MFRFRAYIFFWGNPWIQREAVNFPGGMLKLD